MKSYLQPIQGTKKYTVFKIKINPMKMFRACLGRIISYGGLDLFTAIGRIKLWYNVDGFTPVNNI